MTQSNREPGQKVNQQQPSPRTVAKIFVVDDEHANLQILTTLLNGRDYEVLPFSSGKEALKAARSDPPDLILLDISMPEMNGFEVCKKLKADKQFADLPVIFISGLTETKKKIMAFAVGGVDYVTKPFNFEEVLARVETHLKLHRLQSELALQNTLLKDLVKAQVKEISDSQMATIVALAKLAESRDDDTGRHLDRVQVFCKDLASTLGEESSYSDRIDPAFVENMFHASPLHDVGKVGIPDSILLKSGKLTASEFEVMKTHAAIGAHTLRAVQKNYPRNVFINMGIAIAQHHHEKWDGSGYPDGLAGEQIPLEARIMAVVDVYDALRSKRCYRPALSHEESCGIILEGEDSQFDPHIIEVFRKIADKFRESCRAMTD
ncbi:MAG: Cyclic di-GMP phosphodiesterase response regulator RpfG [Syntrophorhabdus sp. PtaU1.Bin002]|nr:MAG: Cyclic di-GMP phosphodiesterase response regulator RpfG [Syntrophorhabdus sp. PtaB.Bin006]OPY70220.1 MAG: Cyclic di-GMP phosphodiesterase response regulator RpfG [Syntrophorhabdus sp. PtaU1.Bin002]